MEHKNGGGCNAVRIDSVEDGIKHTNQANHYSYFVFSSTDMKAGNEQMPTTDGTGAMTGNTGNGYVRITLIG